MPRESLIRKHDDTQPGTPVVPSGNSQWISIPEAVTRLPSGLVRCEWRSLAFLNYPVPAEFLTPYLPAGLELDTWRGAHWMSLVGLRFQRPRFAGLPVSFGRDFAQVNLRFYVRRRVGNRWRHGVTFLSEVVPEPFLTAAARYLYNENYTWLPTRREQTLDAEGRRLAYFWGGPDKRNTLEIEASTTSEPMVSHSFEEFIAHRVWSYTPQRDRRVAELKINHPRWNVAPAFKARVELGEAALYPPRLRPLLSQPAESAFIAEGSVVHVDGLHFF
jgi:uncharacterized protein